MITIIDYGMGNIGSVSNMIRHVGGASTITGDPVGVAGADKLILPGVGHFDAGMAALRATGLDHAIKAAVADGATLLGICLGMQLLLEGSEEGSAVGLGLVPGSARKFVPNGRLHVPHMGWTPVRPVRSSRLFEPNTDEQRFYFVHSYYAQCSHHDDVAAISEYGQQFVSAYERGNVMGVQFHPEKSHKFGMALFRKFLSC
jgi:glutamine amidotransferase